MAVARDACGDGRSTSSGSVGKPARSCYHVDAMTADLVVVYIAGTLPQAYLLKNLLAEYGVEASVIGEAIHGLWDVPSYLRTQPRVAVRSGDAEFAREVAQSFDAQLRRGAQAVAQGASSAPAESRRWDAWVACPQCGEPRPTYCPGCDTRGTDFPLAEFVTGGDEGNAEGENAEGGQPIQLVADGREQPGESVQLICPVCDDVFRPKFHRRCARCGHDFGNGLEVAKSPADDELNSRAASLLGVLLILAIIVVVILSFAWRGG